jgi:DNA-binding IclR family transcriptional regulator
MKHADFPTAAGGAQSVDRAFALLALIGRKSAQGLTSAELVRQSGLNKATVRRLLLAMIRAGVVEHATETRRYHLGEQAFILGLQSQGRHGLQALAMDSLQRLARETGDAAFISVRRGPFSVCLHREDGAHPIRTYALMPGAYHPLGVGAGSLAMLASLPDAEVESVLAANDTQLRDAFPRLSAEVLREHVDATRAAGHALNPGLIFEDSWGLGVALHGPDGRLVGALSLAAIESRMREPRRSDLAQRLKYEAARVEARLARGWAALPTQPEKEQT